MKTVKQFNGREFVMNQMRDRISKGLDPLTGEKMVTKGMIKIINGKCCDATGREVTLNTRGTWVYKT